ncbi:hypothetical protein GGF31_006491 [Allomyces arbusculus]|nr:hypothetical protein GGF31_006491 [Allomyces arbusculus]
MRKPNLANIPSDMEIAPELAASNHKWHIVERELTINNFQYYVHFKVSTNNLGDYGLITESMIKGWSKVKELMVIVYKYGDQINTNLDLDEFEKEHVRAVAKARERIRRTRVAMTEDQCIISMHINTLCIYHEDMNVLMADIDGALNRANRM